MQSATLERRIALPWLARLRWIAVVGQVGATALAILWLELRLPLAWVAMVISITAVSNLALMAWDRVELAPDWIVPAVILLDVGILSLLLYLTGGTENPFSILYAIHVAMTVVVLGGAWAWLIVALSAICYAILIFRHLPLTYGRALPQGVLRFGQWSALMLVMALIAYFIGRVSRSLRQSEQELAEARERAKRSEHLAALTTLAAGAAHELGTPLSTIALVAKEMELSLTRGEPPAALAEDAQLIRQEVDRCRQILDRMRVDVIEDAGQRPSFETLAELIEDLRNDLRRGETERLLIDTREPGDEVVSRSRVLRRAVGILLRNAFDASGPEGEVTLLFRRDQGRIIFEVQDSGSGMSEEVLRRAGEPFFTTKAPGQGIGMGLFLVRLVAETYGGRFELKSTPGAGTGSLLELPDRPISGDGHADDETEDAGR